MRQSSVQEEKRSSRRTSAAASARSNNSSNSSKTSKNGPWTPDTTQEPHIRKHAVETVEYMSMADVADVADMDQQMSPSHSRDSLGGSGDSAKSVCLCQPDPKIPRPRNAFILYRQHHQGAVSAQNPGLPNPDISKVIGEQWRGESISVKDEWKHLAEEEKLRHQQQFPEYRYRPKRNDQRDSLLDSGSKESTVEKHRCQKCGGRSMTHTSPNTSGARGSASLTHAPISNPAGLPATPVLRYLPMMNSLTLMSPQVRRARAGSAGLHINAAASRHRMSEDVDSPSSPGAKRRRYNVYQPQYTSGRITAAPGTPYFSPPMTGLAQHMQARRESLPPPADLFRTSPPNTGSLMGPPPTPGRRVPALPVSPFTYAGPKPPGWERASLTLPPLHTAASSSPVVERPLPTATSDDSKFRERRSVEAMVMSMSYLGKLKILRKIAPPVGVNPTTPAPSPANVKLPRGAIVAVEGFNRTAVTELTYWLESFLRKTDNHNVRMWEGPRVPDWKSKASIDDFLGVVREWHQRSADMVNFIQPVLAPKAGQSTQGSDENMGDATSTQGAPVSLRKIPVVLLKTYTLQACDRYACAIPIQDAYSPADHWQWMATLWRGTPGADIVVYIKEVDCKPPPEGTEKSNAALKQAADKEKIGTVEIVEEAGLKCLLVWKERGKEVGGSALRRLGFELGEWTRTFGTN